MTEPARMLQLTFQQFRCWNSLTIEIPIGGLTLIKGSSGGGKTTILQGIAWCLYGNLRLVAPNHTEKAKTRVSIEMPYHYNNAWGNLNITRQKNPNRLLLTHNGQSYEDKVAQSIIDDIFGTFDIWLASCYIGQGCRNSFLTAPNTGKMELLNSIAFHEEDPSTYIEKIDANLAIEDTKYKEKLALFTHNLQQYQTLFANVNVTTALSPEQVGSLNQQIASQLQEQVRLQGVKTQRGVDLGLLNHLQQQLAAIPLLQSIPIDANLLALNAKYNGAPLETADHIDANLTRILNVIPLLQRRDDLQAEITRYEIAPVSTMETVYTPTDYQEAISKETIYRDNSRLAESLGVAYIQSVIQDKIQSYQQVLGSQDRLKQEHQRDQLHAQLQQLESVPADAPLIIPEIIPQEITVPDYTKYATEGLSAEITELSTRQGAVQAHIRHLQQGLDVLQCPHCENPIRYQLGKVVPAETGPADQAEIVKAQSELTAINSEITRLQTQIATYNAAEARDRSMYERNLIMEQRRVEELRDRIRRLELEQQRRDIANQTREQHKIELQTNIASLNQSIATFPASKTNQLLTAQEVEQTHAVIGRLASINLVALPAVSSITIQTYLQQQEIRMKREQATLAYTNHLQTIPNLFQTESVREVQHYAEQMRAHWSATKSLAEEKLRGDRLKISLEEQISAIQARIPEDPTSTMEAITIEINSNRQLLVQSEQAHQALKYHAQLLKDREEVVVLNADLADLQVLRQHAVETECRILQQVVDSINHSIEGVCTTLFDRDININLNLFKTLKTTKNVKPVANFTIAYQGGVFDNINQMSGGEGDRASLALTLALNRLSSCPLLMLDESLGSLDLNMKEAAIRAIRENTANTVLVIMHDGIEGLFHNVIDIDELQTGR